jgi:predicted dithiol-disulfide oxidoreductase (DUF899 family)
MTKHMTGTRNEWLAARLELLEAEKELTRRPPCRCDANVLGLRLLSAH